MPVAGGVRETRINVYNPCHHIGYPVFCVSRYDYVGSNTARVDVLAAKPSHAIDINTCFSYTGNYILKEKANV